MLATSVGITVLFLAIFALVHYLDRRLPPVPQPLTRRSAS